MDFRRWGILALPLALTGCAGYFEASITDTSPPSVIIARQSFVNSAVTTSQGAETVENRYLVQASSGALTDKIALRSPNGALVYTSTQGALFNEDLIREMQDFSATAAQ